MSHSTHTGSIAHHPSPPPKSGLSASGCHILPAVFSLSCGRGVVGLKSAPHHFFRQADSSSGVPFCQKLLPHPHCPSHLSLMVLATSLPLLAGHSLDCSRRSSRASLHRSLWVWAITSQTARASPPIEIPSSFKLPQGSVLRNVRSLWNIPVAGVRS